MPQTTALTFTLTCTCTCKSAEKCFHNFRRCSCSYSYCATVFTTYVSTCWLLGFFYFTQFIIALNETCNKWHSQRLKVQGQGLKARGQGQEQRPVVRGQRLVNWSLRTGLSSRTTLGYSEEWLTYWHIFCPLCPQVVLWPQVSVLVHRPQVLENCRCNKSILHLNLMHCGGNQIYGLHVIHNGLFAMWSRRQFFEDLWSEDKDKDKDLRFEDQDKEKDLQIGP